MTEKVQNKNESIIVYRMGKVRLCHEIELNVKDTKEQLLSEPWSRDLELILAKMNHQDLD